MARMLANFGMFGATMEQKVTDFSKQLKAWRKRHRYSILRVSRETGIARETITNIEDNVREPRQRTVKMLLDYMARVSDERKTDVLAPDSDACPAGVVVPTNPAFSVISALCDLGRVILVDGKKVRVFSITEDT